MYQKCPFKTFYGLYSILKVSETSKLPLQTRPTFTAIALGVPFAGRERRGVQGEGGAHGAAVAHALERHECRARLGKRVSSSERRGGGVCVCQKESVCVREGESVLRGEG